MPGTLPSVRHRAAPVAWLAGLLLAGPGGAATVTEWSVPAGRLPFQLTIEPDGSAIYYRSVTSTSPVGRIDTATDVLTEWDIGIPGTSPGDLLRHPTSGRLWLSHAMPFPQENAIAELDPATGALRRWQLPAGRGSSYNFAFDAAGDVVFSATSGSLGKLEPAADRFTFWDIPPSMHIPGNTSLWAVDVDPAGRYLVNLSGFTADRIVRLDPATGSFTAWDMPHSPVYPLHVDAAGSAWFTIWGAAGFRSLGRLGPAIDRWEEWILPAGPEVSDDLAVLADGRVVLGLAGNPSLNVVHDPAVPGTVRGLIPFIVNGVTPATATVTPTLTTLVPTTQPAPRQTRALPEQVSGSFTFIDLGGFNGNRFFAADDSGGYAFVEEYIDRVAYHRATPLLAVRFATAGAQRDCAGAVTVEFTTTAEEHTLGFRLERRDPGAAGFVPLGSAIGAHGPHRLYRRSDPTPRPGATYRVVELTDSGVGTASAVLVPRESCGADGPRPRARRRR